LARIRDEVAVRVQTAYNKVERTQQMVEVSQELLATRQEARRVSAQQLQQGTYLRSQAAAAAAQEFEAQTLLLQSQLEIRASTGRANRRDRRSGKLSALEPYNLSLPSEW